MKCSGALARRQRIVSASSALAVVALFAAQLRLGDLAVGRHAVRQPDAAADRRSAADGDAAEYRRTGIDHDVVLDDGMARPALDQGAVFAGREAARAQGDGLVEAHP